LPNCALRRLRGVEKHGKENFAALCWLLERRHPEFFSRPEVQLAVIQQSNTVENNLTINISQAEAEAIERQSQPVREQIAAMFRQYRALEQGNGEQNLRDIEANPVPEPVHEPPVITHRDGDSDQDQGFWRRLVSAAPESKVARRTAVFAVRWLLAQTIGYKAHRTEINFTEDPTTVEDLFATLERLSGGAGWQAAQKLGGYT
jgi:hypothetical protein